MQTVRLLALVAHLAGSCVTALHGQSAPTREGGRAAAADAHVHATAAVYGVVVEHGTWRPVPGVLLCLQHQPSKRLIGVPPDTGSADNRCDAVAETDTEGRYSFQRLGSGSYHIRAAHIGYETREVAVDLEGRARLPLWLALAAEPVRLHAIVLAPVPATPFDTRIDGSARATLHAASRLPASHAADLHHMTYDDVLRSPSLGEPDVLRSLRRLPGVTTRSDYTTELWTRGAPWYQTRVFFDGLPLFQPLHGLGAFSAVPASAVGALTMEPGVRPASGGDGAAGAVNVRSRRAAGAGELNGRADLSIVGTTLSMDQRTGGGAAGWALTLRRTHLDRISKAAGELAQRPLHVPLSFHDAVVTIDGDPGGAHHVEFSALRQSDAYNPASHPSPDAAGRWGATAARLTVTSAAGDLRLQHTLGGSTHGMRVPEPLPVLDELTGTNGQPLYSSISYMMLRGDATSLASGSGWQAGYEAGVYTTSYTGAAAYSIPRPASNLATADAPGRIEPQTRSPVSALALRQQAIAAAAWAERYWRPREHWRVRGGLRLETGSAIAGTSPLRLLPRVSVTFEPSPKITLHADAGRSFQYTQAVAPAGVHVASQSSGYLWLLAGDDVPALRADLVTLGAALRTGDARLRLALYRRVAAGMTIADPTPGPFFDRAGWLSARNVATGFELSADARRGAWDAYGAYSLGSSELQAAGWRFPAASDVRHVVDAGVGVLLTPDVRLAATYSAATGVPFTRIFGAAPLCSECTVQSVPWAGPPNEARAPAYGSLDLMVDGTRKVWRADVRLYAQLRNALGRDNSTVYTAADACGSGCDTKPSLHDRIERGLPRIPLVGVHVRF